MEWIKAEDAPDYIVTGSLVWKARPEWKVPELVVFDGEYSRESHHCGGYFFALASFPPMPKYDH